MYLHELSHSASLKKNGPSSFLLALHSRGRIKAREKERNGKKRRMEEERGKEGGIIGHVHTSRS